MQKAAIFDLNGVFIQSPPLSLRIQQDFGVPVEQFLPVLSQVMDRTRRPGADDVYACFKPHLEEWEIALSREKFLDYWFSAEQQNAAMVEYARALKSDGWQLFILSNNFRERTAYYEQHFPFLQDIFTHVYYSWQTGHVKPEERCFTQILDQYQLRPSDCVYFDDSDKNVAAAKKLGIQAYKYEGKEQIERILKNA